MARTERLPDRCRSLATVLGALHCCLQTILHVKREAQVIISCGISRVVLDGPELIGKPVHFSVLTCRTFEGRGEAGVIRGVVLGSTSDFRSLRPVHLITQIQLLECHAVVQIVLRDERARG